MTENILQTQRETMNLITGTQIKLARAVLEWRNADLSARSKLGTTTIKKLEQAGENIPSARVNTVLTVQKTLEPELKNLGWFFTENGGIDKL